MAELLQVAARSYADQEHGKYGFSLLSVLYFFSLLEREEVLAILDDLFAILNRKKGFFIKKH